jgi:hypothetical protein
VGTLAIADEAASQPAGGPVLLPFVHSNRLTRTCETVQQAKAEG